MMIRFRQPRVIVGLAVLVVFLFGVLVGIGGAQTTTPVPVATTHTFQVRATDKHDGRGLGSRESSAYVVFYQPGHFGPSLVLYTNCEPFEGKPTACLDWNGFATVSLPAGKYTMLAAAYGYRTIWPEVSVPVPGEFVQAVLEQSPLNPEVAVTAKIVGADIKGTVEVKKRVPGKYDAKIDISVSGPGLGLDGWSNFSVKTVEKEFDDKVVVEFEVPLPPQGLPRYGGFRIYVNAGVLLKNSQFTQDGRGYAEVELKYLDQLYTAEMSATQVAGNPATCPTLCGTF